MAKSPAKMRDCFISPWFPHSHAGYISACLIVMVFPIVKRDFEMEFGQEIKAVFAAARVLPLCLTGMEHR